MSFMRGSLLSKTMKLVKGQAKREPLWLKAMQETPPISFPPPPHGKVRKIMFSEDQYIKMFYAKHPDSLYHDAVRLNGFEQPPSRVFAQRVLELRKQGVNADDAVALADLEYCKEKKAKESAYKRLKVIARMQGKRPPPNPYPSAIKEIQAEEKKYVRARFTDPKILEIVKRIKEDRAAAFQMNRSVDMDL